MLEGTDIELGDNKDKNKVINNLDIQNSFSNEKKSDNQPYFLNETDQKQILNCVEES